MSPLVATPSPSRQRASSNLAVQVAVAAAVAALVALLSPFLSLPDRVPRVTVENPHRWQAHVLSSDGGGSWTGMGTVPPESDLELLEEPDQGDTWVFRFGYAGTSVETTVSREELEQQGWTVTVPDELADALERAGVPRSAGGPSGA